MADYWYTAGSDRQGPIDLAALQGLVTAGTVGPNDYYWTAGMADWQTVSSSDLFAAATPQTAAPSSDAAMDSVPVTESTAPSPVAPSWDSPDTSADSTPAATATTTPAATSASAATAGWSPHAPAATAGAATSENTRIKMIAEKMPKPIWLIIGGVVSGLTGLLLIFGIFSIPIAAGYIWVAVLMFQANSELENARQTGSFEALGNAASKLNTIFAIFGVVTIIGVLFMVAAFFLGALASF